MAAPRTASKSATSSSTSMNSTAPRRISFAKIREPLEVPDLLALQTDSFDTLLGNEKWKARVEAAAAGGQEGDEDGDRLAHAGMKAGRVPARGWRDRVASRFVVKSYPRRRPV